MRKASTIIISIITTITILLMIVVFSVDHFVSEKFTKRIIAEVDINDTIEQLKTTTTFSNLYEQAETYGIDASKMDAILKSEQAKEYANDILQQIITDQRQNKSVLSLSITDEKTKELVDNIQKEFNLNLTDAQQNKVIELTSQTVNQETNRLLKKTTDYNGNSKLANFLQELQNKNLKIGLIITLLVELSLIVILSWPQKSFASYFAGICLALTIILFLISGSLQLILSLVTTDNDHFLTIIKPFINDSYLLTIVFLGITIILFILHKLIQRKIEDKKAIPF